MPDFGYKREEIESNKKHLSHRDVVRIKLVNTCKALTTRLDTQ